MILASSGPGCLVASVTGAEWIVEIVGVLGTDSLPELQDAVNKMSSPVATSRSTIGFFIWILRVTLADLQVLGPSRPTYGDWATLGPQMAGS